jgi:hypothetical protein
VLALDDDRAMLGSERVVLELGDPGLRRDLLGAEPPGRDSLLPRRFPASALHVRRGHLALEEPTRFFLSRQRQMIF